MFTTIDLSDGQIQIGESLQDGSFERVAGDDESVNATFTIRGASDASTAYVALISWLKENYSDGAGGISSYDLPLFSVKIKAGAALGVYSGECSFKYPAAKSPTNSEPSENINNPDYSLPKIEDANFTFQTTGGSAHISTGLQVVSSATYDGSAPVDYGGLIGPHPDGTAEGVDVVTPALSFTIELSLPKAFIDVAYRKTVANLTGSVNSVQFAGFTSRCVLFMGLTARAVWMSWTNAIGLTVKDWYWRASYAFQVAPVAYLKVGETTLQKQGFDAVSRVSERYADDAGNSLELVRQVDIIRPYPQYDFAALKLPF